MRVLLDESVPRALAGLLEGHEVTTVQRQGWQATANGELLRLAGAQFDVFVTADQSIEHQQNLAAVPLGVIPLRDQIADAVNAVALGTAIVVYA